MDKARVAGSFVEYHDVLHASVGPYWKSPTLVGVHFQLEIVVEIVDLVVGHGIGEFWLVLERFFPSLTAVLVDGSPERIFCPYPFQVSLDSGK